MTDTQLAVFKGRQIRRTLHNKEWWFSVVDVVSVLTDSVNPRDYWYKMKIRVKSEDGVELSTLCRQLKLESPDGKKYAGVSLAMRVKNSKKRRRKKWYPPRIT